MELAAKSCTPCRGGVPPLSPDAALELLRDLPGWVLAGDGASIEKKFKFKDFVSALSFVDRISALAEREGHHPDIRFGWGYCIVTLTTHSIRGLHENDFIMAAKINALG